MKQNKWPEFILTLAVRFVFGAIAGCAAYFFFFWKAVLRAFSHDEVRTPLVLMIVCGVIGGIIAACTVPYWQTPWYKGSRIDRD